MTEDATDRGRGRGLRARLLVLAALALLLSGAGLVAPVGHNAPAPAVAAPPSLGTVESLYAQDLVARINAERGARNSPFVSIPALSMDPTLQAEAQQWSAYIASVGQVSDPSLSPCTGPSPGQICVLAANAGDTGYGYWPGDGSDGMDGDYMASTDHRQNELDAAYTAVGVGVTCAGNQAWTVELFGDAYGDMAQANARAAAQANTQGDPVPESPVVAGAPSGDPVYCPGQTVGPNGAVTSTGGQYPYPFAVTPVAGEPTSATSSAVVGVAGTSNGEGYWLVRADGAVSAYGDAVSYGDMSGASLNAPIAHIVATADGHGYWLVAADGGIFSFGDARFQGSMGGAHLNQPVVGMAADPASGGYWEVATDGGIFAFDAPFDGSMGGVHLNQPVNQMAATPDGGGYWFVASDGGIFNFGNAGFHGSAGSLSLAAPIIGMATDMATGGYWLVGSDGGIFSYDAPFFGAG